MGAAAAAQQGSTSVGPRGTNRIDNVSIFYNYNPAVAPVTQPSDHQSCRPLETSFSELAVADKRRRSNWSAARPFSTAVANRAPYSSYTAQNFIRYVKFDNLGGTAHNVNGNLLGVDTGASVHRMVATFTVTPLKVQIHHQLLNC